MQLPRSSSSFGEQETVRPDVENPNASELGDAIPRLSQKSDKSETTKSKMKRHDGNRYRRRTSLSELHVQYVSHTDRCNGTRS